ncbi:putative leucine-rich repeat-containing protein DDB_G0290503 [Halyomorpha halys]|uniref:putative leucine-rich repeat-containing protein DDB_G0290503 n=1 Tax=Halyomorpha halys TaxID=286706 RepID=UPI0034D34839
MEDKVETTDCRDPKEVILGKLNDTVVVLNENDEDNVVQNIKGSNDLPVENSVHENELVGANSKVNNNDNFLNNGMFQQLMTALAKMGQEFGDRMDKQGDRMDRIVERIDKTNMEIREENRVRLTELEDKVDKRFEEVETNLNDKVETTDCRDPKEVILGELNDRVVVLNENDEDNVVQNIKGSNDLPVENSVHENELVGANSKVDPKEVILGKLNDRVVVLNENDEDNVVQNVRDRNDLPVENSVHENELVGANSKGNNNDNFLNNAMFQQIMTAIAQITDGMNKMGQELGNRIEASSMELREENRVRLTELENKVDKKFEEVETNLNVKLTEQNIELSEKIKECRMEENKTRELVADLELKHKRDVEQLSQEIRESRDVRVLGEVTQGTSINTKNVEKLKFRDNRQDDPFEEEEECNMLFALMLRVNQWKRQDLQKQRKKEENQAIAVGKGANRGGQ